jgi:hypothetical protein
MSKTFKLFLIILLLALIGLSIYPNTLSVTAEDTKVPFQLSFESQSIQLSEQPLIINNVPMVPLRAFFDFLGASTQWYEPTQVATVYYRNAFIKLTVDDPTAYYNGLAVTLKAPPVLVDNVAYIPLDFIGRAFDFSVKFVDQIATIKYRDTTRYYFLNNTFYVSVAFPHYNMSLAMPYGWKALNETSYGIKDEYDDYALRIRHVDNTVKMPLADYKFLFADSIQTAYGTSFSYDGDSRLTFNGLTIETLSYYIISELEERYFEVFFVEHQNRIYIFEGHHAITHDLITMRQIYRNIMSTLQFNASTVLTQNEHYKEHPPFINLGMELSVPISSNEEIKETLSFTGTIKSSSSISSIYAKVMRGTDSTNFTIPIRLNGAFNTLLYTPFGLGRHNFEIYAIEKDKAQHTLLMQFSAINLSDRVTRYLIPSKQIQSNIIEITSLASFLTYDKTSEYFKSKALFDWILQEISLKEEPLKFDDTATPSLRDVIVFKRAHALEVTNLLAALLRASDIQARVVAGQTIDTMHYFVEANINGRWIIMDPLSALLVQSYPQLAFYDEDTVPTPMNRFDQYNYITTLHYRSLFQAFKNIE